MIQLAFYKAKGNYKDKLIRIWTNGQYSHVEIIIDGYMYSSSPRDGGVRKKKHTYNTDKWEYINIKFIKKNNIIEFFKMTKKDKYDWFGILGFIIPIKDRTHDWFCSEWVSNALKISECKKLWTKEPSKISPNKLYNILKE